MDRIRIHPDSIRAFERAYNSISDRIEVLEKDLPRLGETEVAETIRQNSVRYRSSY